MGLRGTSQPHRLLLYTARHAAPPGKKKKKKKLCCAGTNKTDPVPANITGPTWSRIRTRKQNPGACLPVGTREWELSV